MEVKIPPMMLRNPLRLASCIFKDNLLPPRTLGSELTSCSAIRNDIFETLPSMVENDKITPIFTTPGFIAPFPSVAPTQSTKIDRSQTRFMVMLNGEADLRASTPK